MLKFLADENFDNTIVRGLFRRNPMLDMVRVQDVGVLVECSQDGELEGQVQYLPW
jgi:hypothetical protein